MDNQEHSTRIVTVRGLIAAPASNDDDTSTQATELDDDVLTSTQTTRPETPLEQIEEPPSVETTSPQNSQNYTLFSPPTAAVASNDKPDETPSPAQN